MKSLKYYHYLLFAILNIITVNSFAETIKSGKLVRFHYSIKLEDGKTIISTFGKQPLEYIHGTRQLISGLESALEGMSAGENKNLLLSPDQAYGNTESSKIVKINKNELPTTIQAGQSVTSTSATGQPIIAIVKSIKGNTATLDYNHPLAGLNLIYSIQVISIEDSAAS